LEWTGPEPGAQSSLNQRPRRQKGNRSPKKRQPRTEPTKRRHGRKHREKKKAGSQKIATKGKGNGFSSNAGDAWTREDPAAVARTSKGGGSTRPYALSSEKRGEPFYQTCRPDRRQAKDQMWKRGYYEARKERSEIKIREEEETWRSNISVMSKKEASTRHLWP